MFQFFINKNLIGFVGICMGLGAIKLRQAHFWSRSLSPIYTRIPNVKKRLRSKVSSCLHYDGTCVCVYCCRTCSGLIYRVVPTWAVCLRNGLKSLEHSSTSSWVRSVTSPKSPIFITPSYEKKILEGCGTKYIDKNK